MHITFKKTTYYNLVSVQEEFVQDSIHEKLRFTYIDIPFNTFEQAYSSKTSISKKCKAIPQALYCIVETICHLAEALFITLSQKRPQEYFKAKIFTVLRDLQGSCGHIASIFSYTYGSYHVEKSSFHKSCYHSFLQGPPKEGVEIPESPQREHHISLPELKTEIVNGVSILTKAQSKFKKDLQIFKGDITDIEQMKEQVRNPVEKGITRQDLNLWLELLKKMDFVKDILYILSERLDVNTESLSENYELSMDILRFYVAEGFFLLNEPKQAISTLHQICFDLCSKQALLLSFAQKQVKHHKIPEALQIIQSLDIEGCLSEETESKRNKLITSIILHYGKHRKEHRAYKVIQQYARTDEIKNDLLQKFHTIQKVKKGRRRAFLSPMKKARKQ